MNQKKAKLLRKLVKQNHEKRMAENSSLKPFSKTYYEHMDVESRSGMVPHKISFGSFRYDYRILKKYIKNPDGVILPNHLRGLVCQP